MDFRKRQQRPYSPLMISGTTVETVSSFKYLSANISEDLTWTAHIQTQVKKAMQRLYHLRQLRKFRVSSAILKTFYSGAIESVLTQCISVWYVVSSSLLLSTEAVAFFSPHPHPYLPCFAPLLRDSLCTALQTKRLWI